MENKAKILIVDDDKSICRTLTLILNQKGHEVEAAGTGAEALQKARARFFNLAILDIKLPDIEGVDLIAPLLEIQPDMTAIVATAYASKETAVVALNEGASAYITKPMNMDEVLFTIQAALEKQHLVEEKRLAQEALQAERNLLRTLIDNIPAYIYAKDSECRFVLNNAAHIQSMGAHDQGEVLGKSDLDVYPEELAEQYFADDQAVIASGQPLTNKEEIVERQDTGDRVWVSVTKAPLKNEKGDVTGLVGISMDITDAKLASEELRASEHRFRQFFENQPEYGYMISPEGLILDLAGSALNVLGYKKEEIVGKPLKMIYAPESLPKMEQIFTKWKKTGHLENEEMVILTKNGDRRTVLLSAVAVRDTEGNILHSLSVQRDVTERVRAEEALRASEERFALAVQGSNDGIWDWDILNNSLYWSPRFKELLGYADDELEVDFDTFESHLHPDDREHTGAAIESHLKDRQLYNLEQRLRTKTGEYLWFLVRGQALWDEAGKPIRMVGSATDITERVWAEEEIRQLNAKLEQRVLERTSQLEKANRELLHAKEEAVQANLAKSEFLSRMSHELRTPLNAILGFAQLLEMDELIPEQQVGVKHISKSGLHLLDLINEVLDISRIEAGRISFSPEPVSVIGIIQETLDLIQPLAMTRRISLKVDVSEEQEYYIQADRQRFKQVLLNLLDNAIKYNSEGGSVVISCEETPENRLQIKVSDTGFGIPPDKIDQVFTPFNRLGIEKIEVEGTGLGLSLSKGLIEMMGGSISVESTVDQGSTFCVELPAAEIPLEELDQMGVSAPAVAIIPGKKAVVLYVEDNISNLQLVEHIMALRPEVELLTCMQGQMSLDLAREHHFDLILLDIHLPDIPGDQVLHILQTDPRTREIPVVVISADAMPGRMDKLLEAGARDFLTKPLNVKQLLQIIDETLS